MNIFSRIKLNWYDDSETARLIEGGEYEPTLAMDRILDLGAHKGFATEYFFDKYPGITIHAYEPNPKLFNVLKNKFKDTEWYHRIKLFNEAISNEDGFVSFYVNDRNVSSSLFGNGKKITVPCVSLATAVARLGLGTVFVKMDIEGAEFKALEHIPENVIEIKGEVHPEKAGRTNSELISLLSRFAHITIGQGKSIFHAV